MNMAKMNTCLHSQTCETGLGFSTVLSAAPGSYMRKEIPCYMSLSHMYSKEQI